MSAMLHLDPVTAPLTDEFQHLGVQTAQPKLYQWLFPAAERTTFWPWLLYSQDGELWNAWQLVFLEFNSPTQKHCKYQTPEQPDKHCVGHSNAAKSNDMFMHVIISVNCKIDTDSLYLFGF